MPSTDLSPTVHALSARVQQNFIAYFRHFAGLPGVTFMEDDITWIASTGPPTWSGFVLSTNLPDEDTADFIDRTLSDIGQHVNDIAWMIFPNCRPQNLGSFLVAYGDDSDAWMLHGDIGGTGGNWMWADLADLPDKTEAPADFRVKRVADEAMLAEWVKINALGFGASDYDLYQSAFARHGFDEDAELMHFIGYMEERPVTSGTLAMGGGSASVYNVSTPEALRRQGFGGAITHAALQEAVKHGYDETWIWSSQLGRSVYEKLGFRMTDIGVREYEWKRRVA